MDCSLPGSSVHGIFQARVLEWGAIAFSDVKYRHVENTQSFLFHLLHTDLVTYGSLLVKQGDIF